MKAKLTVKPEKRFEPITIEIVLESIQEAKDFYKAIGTLKSSYPTDDVYQKMLLLHPELEGTDY